MHGDRASHTGGTRTVTVGASLGTETVYDEDAFAGMTRETVTYNGSLDKPVSKNVDVPCSPGQPHPARSTETPSPLDSSARQRATRPPRSASTVPAAGARPVP